MIGKSNQQRVAEFMLKIPSQVNQVRYSPEIPPLIVRVLRARLMLEECMETIEKGLGLRIFAGNEKEGYRYVLFEEINFVPISDPNIVEIADGLADQEVVNAGTGVVCGIVTDPVFREVMDNNMLKLEKGTIDEFGKLIKPKDHKPPDILKVLREQGYNGY